MAGKAELYEQRRRRLYRVIYKSNIGYAVIEHEQKDIGIDWKLQTATTDNIKRLQAEKRGGVAAFMGKPS